MATKDEKIALGKIAGLGCILCSEVLGITGSAEELHHVRRYGAKRSASPVSVSYTHLTLPTTPYV